MELFNNNSRLHTQVLEDMYGKIEVQLLYQDEEIRECLLMDSQYIARTYALTFKNRRVTKDKHIAAIDKLIQQGESIGKAFKQNGYQVEKNVIAVYLTAIPYWLQLAFDTNEEIAKIRVSEFFVRKTAKDEMILYGTIAEIYSQHFRKAEVRKLDLLQINPSLQAMLTFGFSKQETECFINNPVNKQWDDEITHYSKEILLLKEKINVILNGDRTDRGNFFIPQLNLSDKLNSNY
jgi:hypothetical protein